MSAVSFIPKLRTVFQICVGRLSLFCNRVSIVEKHTINTPVAKSSGIDCLKSERAGVSCTRCCPGVASDITVESILHQAGP